MLLAFTWAACIFLIGLVIMTLVFDDNINQLEYEYEDEDMFEYKERSIKLRIHNAKSKL